MNKNYDFFMKNRAMIIAGHENSYVVIKDEAVQGYFATDIEAIEAMKGSNLGTFIVQKCVNEEKGTVEFYSRRIVFA